jgi:hypothetical protein
MSFPTRIAIVVREDLATWQKLNVACFLAGGLVGLYPELAGECYVDASGKKYGPLVRQPVLVFAGSAENLRTTLERAFELGLTPSIYTGALFTTNNDVDNRAAVAAVPSDRLDPVGIALHGDRKQIDKVTKGLKLHP